MVGSAGAARSHLTLLAFAAVLDEKLADISQQFNIPLYKVRKVSLLQEQKSQHNSYWSTWNELHHQIGSQFYLLTEAVEQAMKETQASQFPRLYS